MVLFLASQSTSRRNLLNQSKIPFTIIDQDANETIDKNLKLEDQVKKLAQLKMEHVKLSDITNYFKNFNLKLENSVCLVLTADTLTETPLGKILGKPKDEEEAKNMVISLRGQSKISTSFCLEKKIYLNQNWKTVDNITQVVNSTCEIDIDDIWIEKYLTYTPSKNIAGALAIENYGMQFIKTINGSYSAILGLPLYELRQALQAFGFFGCS